MNPVPTANYTPIWYTSTFDPVGVAVPTNVANGTRTIGKWRNENIVCTDVRDCVIQNADTTMT